MKTHVVALGNVSDSGHLDFQNGRHTISIYSNKTTSGHHKMFHLMRNTRDLVRK
jgi:hypothetical protein